MDRGWISKYFDNSWYSLLHRLVTAEDYQIGIRTAETQLQVIFGYDLLMPQHANILPFEKEVAHTVALSLI